MASQSTTHLPALHWGEGSLLRVLWAECLEKPVITAQTACECDDIAVLTLYSQMVRKPHSRRHNISTLTPNPDVPLEIRAHIHTLYEKAKPAILDQNQTLEGLTQTTTALFTEIWKSAPALNLDGYRYWCPGGASAVFCLESTKKYLIDHIGQHFKAPSRLNLKQTRTETPLGKLKLMMGNKVPRWTNGDNEEQEEQDEDDCMFSDDGYRASSRASFSSGHHSVPDIHIPLQPPSNLKQTRKAVSKGPLRSEVDAHTSDKPRGKRELQREEQENPERPLARANSRKPSRATKVKVEPEDKHSLSRSHIRKPSTTAAEVKVKTEPVERLKDPDTDSIEIRLNERGAVGTKTQHRDVERMLQLAIDYYFGFHLIENMYPDLRGKTKFSYDSMARATRDLTLAAIANKLRDEEPYREGLVPVVRIFTSLYIW
ncbi:hypothetical protein B0H14DRAFT_3650459 [Mycena olivaceomarginata]|nr:hypothetical protein B0H14DRAFT_3650459 [Mycena olivaceomarginata]